MIPKYYKEEPLQDLPLNNFWMKKLNSSEELSTSITTKNYEIQYNIINEPCKLTFFFFLFSSILL